MGLLWEQSRMASSGAVICFAGACFTLSAFSILDSKLIPTSQGEYGKTQRGEAFQKKTWREIIEVLRPHLPDGTLALPET